MVADFWLRSGDAHTANNFEAFLLQTLSHLQNKTIGLLRADTGFYSKKILNQHSFDATETTLNFIMVAYNLMSLFKQVIVQDKVRPTLKTLRYSCLGIGSYKIKNGRERILKMSLNMKRRSWITKLWENSDTMASPFINLSG